MSEKIIDLTEYRNREHPQTLEEFARDAICYIFDPARLEGLEEPIGLASGKTNSTGGFVPDGEDEIEDSINDAE